MAGSTLPRRALGRTLRRHRIRAGRSQLAAGLAVEISPQSVGRLEDGQKIKFSTSQLRDLLGFYEVLSEEERSEVLGLWDEVRQQDQAAKMAGATKGWWRSYSDQYDAHFDHYLSLEAAANRLVSHQTTLLPGLLQTSEYRRAMIRTAWPNLSAVDVERRLELAVRRQQRLADEGFEMEFLISEAVLRHQPGGPQVLIEQLDRLLEADRRPNVSIRVVPYSAGAHSGLVVQSFTLLEFPPLASRLVEPPVVYVEGYEGALYLEQPEVIERHRQAVSNLREVALNSDRTWDLVRRIAKEYAA